MEDDWVLYNDKTKSESVSINQNYFNPCTETDLLYPPTEPYYHDQLEVTEGIPFHSFQVDSSPSQNSPVDNYQERYQESYQPQQNVAYAPFDINEERARAILKQWKEEQWFAPSDFNRVTEGNLYAFLVPYHCFSTRAHSTFNGKVGYKTVTHSFEHIVIQGRHSINHTIQWQGASVSSDKDYLNYLYCASVVPEDAELLDNISDWDLSKVVQTITYENSLGPSTEWNIPFEKFMNSVKRKESTRGESILRQAHGADAASNISCNTYIPNVSRSLIYLPVYYYGYRYDDKEYKFFLNAQSGKVHGTRPIGLGLIGRGFEKLGSLITPIFMSPEERKMREEWKQMQRN